MAEISAAAQTGFPCQCRIVLPLCSCSTILTGPVWAQTGRSPRRGGPGRVLQAPAGEVGPLRSLATVTGCCGATRQRRHSLRLRYRVTCELTACRTKFEFVAHAPVAGLGASCLPRKVPLAAEQLFAAIFSNHCLHRRPHLGQSLMTGQNIAYRQCNGSRLRR